MAKKNKTSKQTATKPAAPAKPAKPAKLIRDDATAKRLDEQIVAQRGDINKLTARLDTLRQEAKETKADRKAAIVELKRLRDRRDTYENPELTAEEKKAAKRAKLELQLAELQRQLAEV